MDTISHSEFSLIIPKSLGDVLVNDVLGSVLGWMTAQELEPQFSGHSSRFESGQLSFTVTISSQGKSLSLDLFGVFDPVSFASYFGFNIHEDEYYEDGDWCIRTKDADAYLATGSRSTVVVER